MIVYTICPYCGVGCGVGLVVFDNKIVGVEPMKFHPVNEGKLCIKGNYCYEFVHSDERLKRPLVRVNDEFRETTWKNAISIICEKIKEYRDEIGFLSSAKCTNEENYLLQKFARVLGTNNIDHCARLCHAPTVVGLGYAFGSGAMTNSIEDLEESKCILIIGSNTFEQHPLIARRILKAKEKGAKIIVVDPRKTQTANFADIFLQIYPGTNVAVINGLINVIISENLHNKSFIKSRTKGFDELVKSVEKYTPEYVSKICGVNPNLIREAAETYAKAERAAIVYSMGLTQFSHGSDNVRAICNLALVTGNIGKPGTGVNPLRGQNNVQGACDMGALPNVFPGYQRVDDEGVRKKFEEFWNYPLNPEPGLTVTEMIDAAGSEIKLLYVVGENPMVSDPDINKVEKKLRSLDFLVVQDIFMSDTAKLADIVLPAACWAEKDGTFTNTDRRVQLIRKAIDPPDEALPDWKIICMLAKNLGLKGFDFSTAENIFDEIRKVTPQYAGMTYERLGYKGIQWPCPSEDHPGTKILYTEKFATKNGLGRFYPVEFEPPAETPDEDYPFVLTTGRIIFHYHTGTMSRRSEHLRGEINECFVEINPQDAERLEVKDGDLVRVSTRRGSILLRARISNVKESVLFIPFHFSESAANVLTLSVLDTTSKIPELKVCAARIEKVEVEE